MITREVYAAYDEASGKFYHGSSMHRPVLKKGFRPYWRMSDLTTSLSWCRKELVQNIVIYTYDVTVKAAKNYAG